MAVEETQIPSKCHAVDCPIGTAAPDPTLGAANQVSPIGRISLWMAIGGLVVPLLLALIGALLTEVLHPSSGYFMLCVVLLFLVESAALVCGTIARRTASGKAGIAISVISLVPVGFAILYVMPVASGQMGQINTSSVQDTPVATSRPAVEDSRVFDQSDRPTPATPKPTPTPAAPPVQKPAAKDTVDHDVPRPAGKQVPPTPAELAHIVSELPKEFTKGLLGSDVERIRELDTFVREIDFDDGPADFWMQAYEVNQPRSFPERLPSQSEWGVWHIPKAKAHILMWIQPRQSFDTSDRFRVRWPPYRPAARWESTWTENRWRE